MEISVCACTAEAAIGSYGRAGKWKRLRNCLPRENSFSTTWREFFTKDRPVWTSSGKNGRWRKGISVEFAPRLMTMIFTNDELILALMSLARITYPSMLLQEPDGFTV